MTAARSPIYQSTGGGFRCPNSDNGNVFVHTPCLCMSVGTSESKSLRNHGLSMRQLSAVLPDPASSDPQVIG